MTSPVVVSPEFDFIQRNLIPKESVSVRYCMQQAAAQAEVGSWITARLYSFPFLVVSVALSFFNALSYLLQLPFQFLLNAVRLAPLRLVTDPVIGLINVARSLLFVGLGIPLAVSGLCFPSAVFSRFAPDAIFAGEQRLLHENKALKKEVEELREKVERKSAVIEAQAELIRRNASS